MDKYQYIPRKRIRKLLAEALQAPLVILRAGAGFGKTRAVRDYLEESAAVYDWFTCRSQDNIPEQFWRDFCGVLSQRQPTAVARLLAGGLPGTPQQIAKFLASFNREIRGEGELILVFDDFQVLAETQVRAFIQAFINAALPDVKVIINTRKWLVFTAGMQVPVNYLDTDELRFTAAETRELLLAAAPDLPPEEIEEIHTYVEGWPLGLAVLTEALHSPGQPETGSTVLALAKQRLFRLFETEVFSQYSEPEQQMLVNISALEAFPRGMIRAVTGARTINLSDAVIGNIFLSYDQSRDRYYFHPLFHEFLQEKRSGVPASELTAAYRQAARWCREQQRYFDAVNYYRLYDDYAGVWEMLQQTKASRRSVAEAEFIIEHLRWLPAEFRAARPLSEIMLAMMLTNNLQFDAAEAVFRTAYAAVRDGDDAEVLGEYYTAYGLFLLATERDGFADYFAKADVRLPRGSRRWDNQLQLVDLGPGLHLNSRAPGALERTVAAYQQGVPAMVRVMHGAGQGLDALVRCEAAFLQGDLKSALTAGYKALYLGEGMSQYDIVGNALLMILRIYLYNGDDKNITDTLEHVDRYKQYRQSQDLGIWDIIYGWYYTEIGQTDQVVLWIRNAIHYGYAPVSIDRAVLVRLRCLVEDKRYAEAVALIEQFMYLAEAKQALITLLYLQIGLAAARYALGQKTAAVAALAGAYELAVGNEIIMPFVEYGGKLRALFLWLKQHPQAALPEEWVSRLYAKITTGAKKRSYLKKQQDRSRQNDFGLSERELEVLKNLSQGLTQEEIGRLLYLSPNTVKGLLKQIYGKLGAINGADAVRIAISNQLI